MKNSTLKFGLFFILGLSAVVLSSCNRDNDDNGTEDASKIIATNVFNSSSEIVKVKAQVPWEEGDDSGFDPIAEANYENNGFTLQLPSTTDKKYLKLIYNDDSEGIIISDKQAQFAFLIGISAHDKDDEIIGVFTFGESKSNEVHITQWLYVDRDDIVNGELTDEDEVEGRVFTTILDYNLKKGWNQVYLVGTETHNSTGNTIITNTYTSKKPSGANYKWYYTSWDNSTPEKLRFPFFKMKR